MAETKEDFRMGEEEKRGEGRGEGGEEGEGRGEGLPCVILLHVCYLHFTAYTKMSISQKLFCECILNSQIHLGSFLLQTLVINTIFVILQGCHQ